MIGDRFVSGRVGEHKMFNLPSYAICAPTSAESALGSLIPPER